MSETYADGGQGQTTAAGGIIIAVISAVSALLVIAALIYAAGTGGRHQAALAAAGCEPNLSPSGLPCTTAQLLARRFATMTHPALQQVNTDAAAYTFSATRSLAAAQAALRTEAASENALSASLARFPFPPAVAAAAAALIEADQA